MHNARPTCSTRPARRRAARPRRGSVILIVIWSIAIAAVFVAATQVIAFRQATMGREALARIQARWAARAGIEETISVLEYHTQKPDPEDVMALYRDLEAVSERELLTGGFTIRHVEDGEEKPGPQDENAKVNVNLIDRTSLLNLSRMTFDVADALLDWRDTDDNVQGLGAERDYYVNRNLPYEPRNGPLRSILELELIAGGWPEYVRGEDANLNNRFDPNEDDGSTSPPNDNADGRLNGGWAAYLTAVSSSSRISTSGKEKLYLKDATTEDIMDRLGIDEPQAKLLQQFAAQPNARMEMLLVADLNSVVSGSGGRNNSSGGSGGSGRSGRSSSGLSGGGSSTGGSSTGGNSGGSSGQPGSAKPLDTNQLRAVFREATFDAPDKPLPAGRVNINTAPTEVLRLLLGIDPYTADGIIALRNAKPGGITSIVDLLGSNKITPQVLTGLAGKVDVTSQVFTITSRGRSEATGLEVEITAVVDRSTLPARILEYREQ